MMFMTVMFVTSLMLGQSCLGHQLSAEDKLAIVDTHNSLRSKVHPPAANMRKLSWNTSLESIAQSYVAKCVWEHNPELEGMGENIYAISRDFDASKAVTEWYMEHLYYTYDNNSCTNICGHYTQVVWADTESVGCSSHFCTEAIGLSFKPAILLVCDYYPTGNFIGMLPYKQGPSCSQCVEHLQECETNICVAKKFETTESRPTLETQTEMDTGTDSGIGTDSGTDTGIGTEKTPASTNDSKWLQEDWNIIVLGWTPDVSAGWMTSCVLPLLITAALLPIITL